MVVIVERKKSGFVVVVVTVVGIYFRSGQVGRLWPYFPHQELRFRKVINRMRLR